MESIFILLLIGAFGGLVRSFLGYRGTPEDETFNYRKLGQTLVAQMLIGAFVVFGATNVANVEINTSHYVMALFLACDVQSLLKTSGRSDVKKS